MDRAQEGKRVDRWLSIAAPALPMGLRQKYLRLKRVKVNGRPAKGEDRLNAGDVVNVFTRGSHEYLGRGIVAYGREKLLRAMQFGGEAEVDVIHRDNWVKAV